MKKNFLKVAGQFLHIFCSANIPVRKCMNGKVLILIDNCPWSIDTFHHQYKCLYIAWFTAPPTTSHPHKNWKLPITKNSFVFVSGSRTSLIPRNFKKSIMQFFRRISFNFYNFKLFLWKFHSNFKWISCNF